MKQVGRFILILVLMTAFADLVPTIQDFLEPHTVLALSHDGSSGDSADSGSVSITSHDEISDPHAGSNHHHDGPCVGGHCHLGHCAFIAISLPVVRFAAEVSTYELKDSQVPSSPVLDTMKRPPRA